MQVMNSKINNNPVPNKNTNQTKKVTSPYTEDWINVKAIKNGVILLPNREMVTGVKIMPKNIFILDSLQQESILNAMKNFYNLLTFEFWLIAADRPVDISVYQSQLQIMLQNATNPFNAWTGKKYSGYQPKKEVKSTDYNALRMGKTQPETSNDEPIDYENIEYPKGTSKKYTKYVNEQFENAKPILEKAGIKLEDFGGKPSKEGGYEDNTKEIMNKYVFEPFRKKYPNGNNDVYEKEYQPLYDAIEAVADKNYNDWYIRNNKK